ncbi:glycosyltransferase [Sphingomonas sp. Leaf28]|jgi:hypothetical protein|nr:glycosyltransferase [Sphingomonas sp. Leaf28]
MWRSVWVERRSAIPGVEMVGIVDKAEYRAACVAIAPIRRGGVTKIKVIEALTMGVPCVCTSHAANDFDVLTSLTVTDDAVLFGERCMNLPMDAAQRADLARAGFNEIADHFAPDDFARGVEGLLHSISSLQTCPLFR